MVRLRVNPCNFSLTVNSVRSRDILSNEKVCPGKFPQQLKLSTWVLHRVMVFRIIFSAFPVKLHVCSKSSQCKVILLTKSCSTVIKLSCKRDLKTAFNRITPVPAGASLVLSSTEDFTTYTIPASPFHHILYSPVTKCQ